MTALEEFPIGVSLKASPIVAPKVLLCMYMYFF